MLSGEAASSITGISEVSGEYRVWWNFFFVPLTGDRHDQLECDLNIMLTISIDRPAGLRCRYLQPLLHPDRRR